MAKFDESHLRAVERMLKRRGINVRRENLSRGNAFRVRSGDCVLEGDKLLFVDKRLPPEQQLGLLVEYLTDSNISFTADELKVLPPQARSALVNSSVNEHAVG